jgi:hypothetical protein
MVQTEKKIFYADNNVTTLIKVPFLRQQLAKKPTYIYFDVLNTY